MGSVVMWVVSAEVGKLYGDTPTSILQQWYFGKNSKIFVHNNMSRKFTQSAINLMNALLDSLKQRVQAWHEGLEMIFDIVVKFNIQFLKTKLQTNSMHWACSRTYF